MRLILALLFSLNCFAQGLIVDPFRFVVAGSSFDPDAEASIVFRSVADDISGTDGAAVGPDDGGLAWPSRIGSDDLDTHPWTFGNMPELKTGILNGKKVVRHNGVASEDSMRVPLVVSSSELLVAIAGVKRGSANNTGFLTLHNGAGDDNDSASEFSLDEGTGGAAHIRITRSSVLGSAPHPGVDVPFIFMTRWDGTNQFSYLGDWRQEGVASSGSFSSTHFGIAARQQGGGYNSNSRIDVADVSVFTEGDESLAQSMAEYYSDEYAIALPKVLIILGDSISQPGQWDDDLKTSWAGTPWIIQNYAVGGHDLDQCATDATDNDIYNRIVSRVEPGRTVVFIWEYVNAKNGGDTDQQIVDKTETIADLARAAGALVLVAEDFHDGSTAVDCSGASAAMLAQYSGFADGIADLNEASIRAQITDGTHINSTGDGIVAGIVKAAAEALLP